MIMLRNDSRALRDGFSMIMLRLYKHVPCMPSSAPSTNQRHQHRRRFIVIVCSRAGSMSWYVVFQVEGNANFLVPSDLHPAPYFQFGYWPVRNLHMKVVRGGQRACTSATVGCGWELGRVHASGVPRHTCYSETGKAFIAMFAMVHDSTPNVHPTNIGPAGFVHGGV